MAMGPVTEVRGDKKSCSSCGEFKPFEEFFKDPKGKLGLSAKCKDCQRVYNRILRRKQREDPRWLEGHRKTMAAYRKRNPDSCRNARLKNVFGITLDDYNDMLSSQKGGCAICRRDKSSDGRALHVDHDHATGEVRGLLCNHCNRGIAAFMDDPALLAAAISYLEITCE